MAKLNLSQAAKIVGKNRTTIWRHISSGKLSAERDRDGLPFVDTSELIRVYGELKLDATHAAEKLQHQATPSYEDLIEAVYQLREEQIRMREQIISLTNRLTHTPLVTEIDNESTNSKNLLPEHDPHWPEKITSMADIIKRQEIKGQYDKS